MKRLVFFGTPSFALPCLELLHASSEFEVVHVISQPDRPAGRKMRLSPSLVKKRALSLSLPVSTPETCSSKEFLDFFKSLEADLAVVVAFGQILPQKLLDTLPSKFFNLHASLLPRWRGAAPIQRAIMAGDQESGVSLQSMVKKLDAGDVVAESKTLIGENETALELHDRLAELGAKMTCQVLPGFLSDKIKAKPQDETQVTYAHKLDKSESKIDWNLAAQQIHQNIRGLSMGPGSYGVLSGKKLKIHRCEVLEQEGSIVKPGEVQKIESDSFVVQTACGQLKVTEVQPESKPKMPAQAFITGHRKTLEKGFEN